MEFLPGSGVTPTEVAQRSPMDLLIASPGYASFFNQTLKGPYFCPFSNLVITHYLPEYLSTLPPDLFILSFSAGISGLWSLLN
jgi:hypothetical protein